MFHHHPDLLGSFSMKSSLIKKGDDRNEIFIPLPSHFTENLISPDSNQKLAYPT